MSHTSRRKARQAEQSLQPARRVIGLDTQLTPEQEVVLFSRSGKSLLSFIRAAETCHYCRRPIFIAPGATGEGGFGESYQMLYPLKCGSRLPEVCPGCAALYGIDAKRLISLGLEGDGETVPCSVSEHHRVFFTITEPGLGGVHHYVERKKGTPGICHPGKKVPCPDDDRFSHSCGKIHKKDDAELGTPLCPSHYDTVGQILHNAIMPDLYDRWKRDTVRELEKMLHLNRDELQEHANLVFVKVAETQLRGAIHFHGFARLDGPNGQASEPTKPITDQQIVKAMTKAARKTVVHKKFEDPEGLYPTLERDFRLGEQFDVIVINDKNAKFFAKYAAKYVTKGISDAKGFAHEFRSLAQIDALPDSAWWPRQLAHVCWIMGEDPRFKSLNLKKRANALGFPNRVLSASHGWSVSFTQLKQLRKAWAIEHQGDRPQQLNLSRELFEDDTVTWGVVATGWHSPLDALAVRSWWRQTEEDREIELAARREQLRYERMVA